jgi:hypothetical protein
MGRLGNRDDLERLGEAVGRQSGCLAVWGEALARLLREPVPVHSLTLVRAQGGELALEHIGDVNIVVRVRASDQPRLADLPRA